MAKQRDKAIGAVLCRACALALGRMDEWTRGGHDYGTHAKCDQCGRRNLCVLMAAR
jgi:hypothetical protein